MSFCLRRVAAIGLLLAAASAESSATAILGFLGHPDAAPGAYDGLLGAIRSQAPASMVVRAGVDLLSLLKTVAEAHSAHPEAKVFLMGHGMTGGAGKLQDVAPKQPGLAGVVLLGGFLRRGWREGVPECKSKWRAQPTRDCPKGKGLPLCPGGFLPDSAHACGGPAVPAPRRYPVPTLTIGGELDGNVRVARIAEAWYTQQGLPQHPVALVEGMNHGVLMSPVPEAVMSRDAAAEIAGDDARLAVAELVAGFVAAPGTFQPPARALEDFFAPFVEMFVRQEGSWWWTSSSDERGASAWAAGAQPRMSQPMPMGFDQWRTTSEFHLLSDEELIPPYYRSKHRAHIALTADNRTLTSSVVAQLRYIRLSVSDVKAGLDGWAVIREEKAGVLSQRGFADDGSQPVAAIEIGTKLVSRQESYSVVGAAAPESLDDGDRCRSINQAALDLALAAASTKARTRYQAKGRRLAMGPDKKPFPPAGPWWIWNYLQYDDRGTEGVEVRSWYAFYPLSGPAYGAGNHYCKLLSPAWALEWIYTDSLRPVLPPSANATVLV